jgi:hypothetical protein
MVELCDLLRRFDHDTVLIGDINMPDIEWDAGRAGAKGRLLLRTTQEEGLHQMGRFPTHI